MSIFVELQYNDMQEDFTCCQVQNANLPVLFMRLGHNIPGYLPGKIYTYVQYVVKCVNGLNVNVVHYLPIVSSLNNH